MKSFEDFWPFYLSQHLNRTSRRLHLFGIICAYFFLLLSVTCSSWFFVLVPVIGYGPAWIGHYVFERNVPATFKYPLWSLRGDHRMALRIIKGTLESDLKKLGQ